MQRRSLLASILAACAAPAIVRAGVLMPIATRQIWVPEALNLEAMARAEMIAYLGRQQDELTLKYFSAWEQMHDFVDVIRLSPPQVFSLGAKLYL